MLIDILIRMKNIIFAQHAIAKLEILTSHNFIISKEVIENSVFNPDRVESGYKNRLIAQKELDLDHVLRIVYDETEKGIRIITFYPGRKERYAKD